jgi:hypothetical protein
MLVGELLSEPNAEHNKYEHRMFKKISLIFFIMIKSVFFIHSLHEVQEMQAHLFDLPSTCFISQII